MAFDVERFRALSRAKSLVLGAPLVAMPTTGSTNDDAMAAARGGAVHGATFVADEQTAGRGRRGNRWVSRPGESLTFSVVLRLELPPERVAALPLAVGLAVRSVAADRVVARVAVKWPNDVLADGKKLAGILVESQIVDHRVAALVLGVGINVSMRELPAEIVQLATSLALLGATRLEREELLADLLEQLERRLETFTRHGVAGLLDELSAHDALRGKRVRIDGIEGIGRGFADDGALLVEARDGAVQRVISGNVELG